MSHDFTGLRCLVSHGHQRGPCQQCRRCGWVPAGLEAVPCGVLPARAELALQLEAAVSTSLRIYESSRGRVVFRSPAYMGDGPR